MVASTAGASTGLRSSFEQLEARRLLAVSIGADGWTVFTPSADSRIVYVSSTEGNDANNGLSPESPVQTLTRGKALMRNGMPDWLLLKRGDQFNAIGRWQTGGRNSDEPQLIGAYGEGERPLIKSGLFEGFTIYGGSSLNHIAITSVHFWAHTYDGNNGSGNTVGIRLLRQGTDFLVEDVAVQGYKDNIVVQGDGSGISDFRLRRSVIVDAYAAGKIGHSQGIYVSGSTRNILVEQSVFDHNGWNERSTTFNRTVFNHNLYIQNGTQNVIVRDNIISRGSLTGIQLRQGGLVERNLFVQNAVGVYAGGSAATIVDNVFLEGTDMQSTQSGVAIDASTLPSLVVQNNIIANDISSTPVNTSGIQLAGKIDNADISHNIIYNWKRGIRNYGGSNIQIHHNQVQDPKYKQNVVEHNTGTTSTQYWANLYHAGNKSKPFRINGYDKTLTEWRAQAPEPDAQLHAISYVDPNRSLGTYNGHIGEEPTFDAYIAAARATGRHNWRDEYTAAPAIRYIREGYTAIGALPGWDKGLRAEYFNNPDFTGSSFTRIERGIDFNFKAKPAPSIDPTTFSARWTGQIQVDSGGTYTFHTDATDGVRLWIDGQLVIDRWHVRLPIGGDANLDGVVNVDDFNILSRNFAMSGMTWQQGDFTGDGLINVDDFNILARNFAMVGPPPLRDSGSITLDGGQRYDIRLEYFNTSTVLDPTVKLMWQLGTNTLQTVPNAQFFLPPEMIATNAQQTGKTSGPKAQTGKPLQSPAAARANDIRRDPTTLTEREADEGDFS